MRNINYFLKLFILLSLIISLTACRKQTNSKSTDYPQFILWAWERPENLDFIDNTKFGVAFLAQTLQLTKNEVNLSPRRQSLKVPPNTKLIAVTRIETNKRSENKADLSDLQREEILGYVLKTIELKNVTAVQIDFDATVSEREFYRKILTELRQKLPREIMLSITALASFCIDDNWIKDLPVDEVVPMIFRMGADEKSVKNYLAQGNDFQIPICRTSYGIAIDEPFKNSLPDSRRIYIFNFRPWTQKDLEALKLGKKD